MGADARERMQERMRESRCERADARERMRESGFLGADSSLANLIGSDRSHDLESAPASALASALVPCDLSEPMRELSCIRSRKINKISNF